MKMIALIFALLLTACATPPTPTKPLDATKTELAVVTHADLQAAAAYATAHGYPARAAVWTAEDARLTAIEVQISACANAIQAALPPAPTAGAPVGVFTAVEMGAEAVGQYSGVPASVKINCAPFPIVTLPALPKP
jgi:pectin methylesterase-like acyl-CoA thioesterase